MESVNLGEGRSGWWRCVSGRSVVGRAFTRRKRKCKSDGRTLSGRSKGVQRIVWCLKRTFLLL